MMRLRLTLAFVAAVTTCSACGPRLNIVTGTTIGLKASPGDGQTSLPQVTLAYKRMETALLPTKGAAGTYDPNDASGTSTSDAYSALGTFFMSSKFFGDTTLESFISTGHAAQNLAQPGSGFQQQFAKATLGVVPAAIQKRRLALLQDPTAQNEAKAQQILDLAAYPKQVGATAVFSLKDAISRADSDAQLSALESAFFKVEHP